MLKRNITYENPFTNDEVTEEHFFHISKADLVEMEMEEHKNTYQAKDGKEYTGMQAKLQRIVDSEDGKAIIAEFRDIIRRAYGKKDGDRFRKSKEISEDFLSSEAYSQLLFELCTDPNAGAEFISKVVPSNLEQIAADVRAQAEQAQKEEHYTAGQPEADGDAPSTVPAIAAVDNAAASRPTTGPLAEEREAMQGEDGVRILSTQEVAEMDSEELKSGLAVGRYKLS